MMKKIQFMLMAIVFSLNVSVASADGVGLYGKKSATTTTTATGSGDGVGVYGGMMRAGGGNGGTLGGDSSATKDEITAYNDGETKAPLGSGLSTLCWMLLVYVIYKCRRKKGDLF
jgi:hypothetical protein